MPLQRTDAERLVVAEASEMRVGIRTKAREKMARATSEARSIRPMIMVSLSFPSLVLVGIVLLVVTNLMEP